MTKQVWGIDIGDGRLSAVALERRKQGPVLTACHSLPSGPDADLVEGLGRLLSLLGRPAERVVYGLSLSLLGVRNLSLPFKDAKSIAQTLPFELEEQLITPLEGLVADFSVVEAAGSGSRIIAFTVAKTLLGSVLEGMPGPIDPDAVMPAAVALAARVGQGNEPQRPLLLLHQEEQSLTMVLLTGETPVLYRRLPYPEQLLQSDSDTGGQATDRDSGEGLAEAGRLLAEAIQRSIDFFRFEYGSLGPLEVLMATGLGPGGKTLAERIGDHLGLPLEPIDLLAAAGVQCADASVAQAWADHACDGALALALALQGLGRKGSINFRKGEFMRPLSLRASRKQVTMAAAAAALVLAVLATSLWLDYRRLASRDRALKTEMTRIYTQTFPAVTKVVEPLAEMQAAMKRAQGPGAPIPPAVTGQRVLALLADISGRIPAEVSVQVGRLSIDHESVLIKGTTTTFNAVETIKSGLAASPRFSEVKIVSATADKGKGGGLIRFELQAQVRGG